MALINDLNKSEEEIAKEMIDAMPDKYQKTVGFYTWDILRAISKSIIGIWDKLKYIANLDDLSNMELEDLIVFVKERRGIDYKSATKSSGKLKVTAGYGTIQKGDLFQTEDGTQFQAVETQTVEEGGFFSVECLIEGIEGNVPENSITIIPATISGIVSVTNPEAFTNGYEAETKEELYQRYLEDLQKPITSGNIYHYKKWALEVTGVKYADVKPLWDGDNSVKVLIVDQNSNPANEELIQAVQNYIDPYELDENNNKKGWGCGKGQAPIGAYCTVAAPDKLELTISAEVKIKAGEILETVKERIQNSINDFLSELIFSEEIDYVSYARIGAAILNVEGIMDYENLLINGGSDNIIIPNSEISRSIAVLKELNLVESEDE